MSKFIEAIEIWQHERFGRFEDVWRRSPCQLLAAAAKSKCVLNATEREKLDALLNQPDDEQLAIAQHYLENYPELFANLPVERQHAEYANAGRQLADFVLGIAHTVNAGCVLVEETTKGDVHDVANLFESAAAKATGYLSRLWPIDATPPQSTKAVEERSQRATVAACDELLKQPTFQQQINGMQINTSGFLTFMRLLAHVRDDSLQPLEHPSPVSAPILLANPDHSAGAVCRFTIELLPSTTVTGSFLDPLQAGFVVLDDDMLRSLAAAARTARFSLCKLVQDLPRAAAICIAPKLNANQVSGSAARPLMLHGASGGLMLASEMLAIAEGKRLNRHCSATAQIDLDGDLDGDQPMRNDQLRVLPVAPASVLPKIRAATAAAPPVEQVLMEKAQAEDFQDSQQCSGVVIRPVETFLQAYQRLTADSHAEAILHRYCDIVATDWDRHAKPQSEHDIDEEHRIDHFVYPSFSLLDEGRTPFDSSKYEGQQPRENEADPRMEGYQPIPAKDEDALIALLDSHPWLCVTEDAGFGKSVFAWKSQAYFCSTAGQQRFYDRRPLLVARWEGMWPSYKQSGEPMTLNDALADAICKRLGQAVTADEASKAAAYALRENRVVLILDALDQFSDAHLAHLRTILKTNADNQHLQHCRVILTSRAYKVRDEQSVFLGRSWRFARIDGFTTDDQHDRYLADLNPRWHKLVPDRKVVAELLRSPIVLRMIRDILEKTPDGDEPRPFHNRGDLYWAAATRLLQRALEKRRRELEKKNIPITADTSADLRRILATLAFEMMLDRQTHQFVSPESRYAVDGTEKIREFLDAAEHRFLQEIPDHKKTDEYQRWKHGCDILREIEFTNHSVLEACNKSSLSFRSLKTMEFYAGLYLANYAREACVAQLDAVTNDPAWYWVWRFAIEMPGDSEARQPRTLCRSLGKLYDIPPHGNRPTELMYRCWHFFEQESIDAIRQDFPDEPVLPGAADVVRQWRWQLWERLADCGEFQKREVLRLFPESLLLGVLKGDAVGNKSDKQRAMHFDFVESQLSQLRQLVEPFRDELLQRLLQDQTVTNAAEEPSYRHCPPDDSGVDGNADRIQMQTFTVTESQFAVFGVGASYKQDEPRDRESDRPAVYVTWYDAWMFSKWLGPAFHLPLVSQWELACRAGTGTDYWWGPEFEKEHCNASESGIGRTLGRRESASNFGNPWGLYHTSGNVREWCFDWYSLEGSFRVLRGGSFGSGTKYCRSSRRNDDLYPHGLDNTVGFRLCLSSVFRSRSDL